MKRILKLIYEKGRYIIPLDTEGLETLAKQCVEKYSGFVSVTLSKPYKSKTQKENSKYWVLCTELGRELGMSKEEVSEGVKERAIERGYPFTVNKITGSYIPKSIREDNTKEQAILIETVYQVASEMGVYLE